MSPITIVGMSALTVYSALVIFSMPTPEFLLIVAIFASLYPST